MRTGRLRRGARRPAPLDTEVATTAAERLSALRRPQNKTDQTIHAPTQAPQRQISALLGER